MFNIPNLLGTNGKESGKPHFIFEKNKSSYTVIAKILSKYDNVKEALD